MVPNEECVVSSEKGRKGGNWIGELLKQLWGSGIELTIATRHLKRKSQDKENNNNHSVGMIQSYVFINLKFEIAHFVSRLYGF